MIIFSNCKRNEEDFSQVEKYPEYAKELKEVKPADIDSIWVIRNGTDKKLLLEGQRRETFLNEFLEILKREPKYVPVPPPRLPMAPELTIILVFNNKNRREFLAYGRGCVLLDTKSKGVYQFYMGTMILDDWLGDEPVK